MVFTFFSLIIFFGILFFFGWQLVRYFLKENRIEYLIGLSGIFGVGFYVFLINAIGHFIPIKLVFYLVPLLFFILGLGLFYFNKSKSLEWEIDRKWRKILLGTTLFLVVTCGIISFRWPLSLFVSGITTAATIAEGNFPPLEIWAPNHHLYYHYVPELFSAAIYKVTGLPLYLAYDFQVAIMVGILFLLGFILIKRFCHDNFRAFISSLLMLHAGTLVFLNAIKGIPTLYNLYILHLEVFTPFKFVSDAFTSGFFIPALQSMIGISWSVLAFPLIIAVIYLYFYLVDRKTNKIAFLLLGLLLALLALTAEVYFAVLSLILFIYPFAFGFIKRDWEKGRKFLFASFLILIVALPIAFLQGGVLTGVLAQLGSGEYNISCFAGNGGLFTIGKAPWLLLSYPWPTSHFRLFLVEWGLLFVLLIPTFILLFKRYFQLGLFLAFSLIVFFSIPFLITFNNPSRDAVLTRFFWPVNLLGGLAVGLFFGNLYLSVKKTILKKAVIFIIIILMTQSLLFQLFYLSVGYPPGVWNAAGKICARPDSSERKAYDWVKTNTTIKDYFLIVQKDSEYIPTATPNYKFILNTGRMAPIYAYDWLHYKEGNEGNLPFPESNLFKEVKENCNPAAVKSLRYSYLYVDEKWQDGLEEKCLANNTLELKFEAGEGNKFVRIYKVLSD